MKINIELDVSPEELRTFFGLPDLEPIQQEMLQRIKRQIEATSDPAFIGNLAGQMLAGGMQSVDALQRSFFELLGGAGKSTDKDKHNDGDNS